MTNKKRLQYNVKLINYLWYTITLTRLHKILLLLSHNNSSKKIFERDLLLNVAVSYVVVQNCEDFNQNHFNQ